MTGNAPAPSGPPTDEPDLSNDPVKAPPEPLAPAGPHATSYRTHTLAEIGPALAGKGVTICGAVDRKASNTDFVLRDAHGTVQVVLDAGGLADLMIHLDDGSTPEDKRVLTLETQLQVHGRVEAGGPDGKARVRCNALVLLSAAKAPLLFDFRDEKLPARERIRHRYLYLRKPSVHEAFRARTRLLAAARSFLEERGFLEVQTPLLGAKWTADLPESFLAIRGRERVFTLPGRRPLHGELLCASGFDRVFEVARRFRRKATYGPFQQPEFTVLDIHAAFVGEDELGALADALCMHLLQAVRGEPSAAPLALPFEEAMARFGTDAPDLRREAAPATGAPAAASAATPAATPAPPSAAPPAPSPSRLARVNRLPYFRFDEEQKSWVLAGDPLTRPVEEELADDPHRLHSRGFYLALDGVNVGGGGVRNHDLTAQRDLFEVLGLGIAEVDARYGPLLQVLRAGTPPRGRIAIGVDRLLALGLGLPSIDDVIAMPKTAEGDDPLTRAPTRADKGLIPGLLGF